MIDLSGKRALVTGGSRGIGAAIVEAIAENGADVAFTYQRATEKAAAIVRSIEAHGRRAVAIQADSADPKAIAQAVEDAVAALGGLDILVNSAATGHSGNIADLDLDEYQTLMDVNVRAPVLFAKAVIPHLRDGGRIITIGSALGERVRAHAVRNVEGGTDVLHAWPFSRTGAVWHHREPRPAWRNGHGRQPGKRRGCRLPAKPDVAGALR